jgi:hypothetical protein
MKNKDLIKLLMDMNPDLPVYIEKPVGSPFAFNPSWELDSQDVEQSFIYSRKESQEIPAIIIRGIS